MKRVLILASVASMISQFNMNHIRILQDLGYQVDVGCNFLQGNTCNARSIDILKNNLAQRKVRCYQIDFSRNIGRIYRNVTAYFQVKRLLQSRRYDFIHCHSPIGGFIGRIAGKRTGTKVIYTAHGFHFYRGGPIKSWLCYFPAEWFCSWITDVLITINQEDFKLAKRCMHAKSTEYVPGIGIDLEVYRKKDKVIQNSIKRQLGIVDDSVVLLSIGELNRNKNHKTALLALEKIKEKNFIYLICGKGEQRQTLKKMIVKKGLSQKVRLLGYREDMFDIFQAADIFLFPSKREGLSAALMEAMACGLPVVCSEIRGNVDLITHGKEGFLVSPADAHVKYMKALRCLIDSVKLRESMGQNARRKIINFSLQHVEEKMKRIYLGTGF